MKILLISLCAFSVFACEPQKVTTYLELDEGCFGLGYDQEVRIVPDETDPYSEPGYIVDGSLYNKGIGICGKEFIWDGEPGKWTRFKMPDGIEYQSFILRFCPQ